MTYKTSLTLVLAGCIGAATSLAQPPSASLQDESLILTRTDGTRETLASDVPTAVTYQGGLLWFADNERELYHWSEGTGPVKVADLDHDVEYLCGVEDTGQATLYAVDGEGGIHFYGYEPASNTLRLLQVLATNPDVEYCTVSDDGQRLIYSDPHTGNWQVTTAIESDPVFTAYTAPLAPTEGITALTPIKPTAGVTASVQTTPVRHQGDVADDPAIWINPRNPARSLVLGTDKREGLRVYGLDGEERQFLAVGRVNNVDVRTHRGETWVAASNRTEKSIDLFRIDPSTGVVSFAERVATAIPDPYGLCMGVQDNRLYTILNGSEGELEIWQHGRNLKRVASAKLASTTEGCVVDDTTGELYIGEETVGIWRGTLPRVQDLELVIPLETGRLVADVEGLAIYHGQTKLLVASSQGDDHYAVYRLPDAEYLGRFQVIADLAAGIDGSSETDGLDVTATALPGYPAGLLVVQDGRNRMPGSRQNFKLIDWQSVARFLALP